MNAAAIALGSNLGERERLLNQAIAHLRTLPKLRVEKVSSFLETDPVGGPPGQGRYLNGAVLLATDLTPRELLDVLLATEHLLGRDRSSNTRNAPRTIDLDLLLYADLQIHEPGLIVPHPRMHEREFVLRPLAEIAPELIHPITKKSIGEIWNDVKSKA